MRGGFAGPGLVKWGFGFIGTSSNGKTAASGAAYGGSQPCVPATAPPPAHSPFRAEFPFWGLAEVFHQHQVGLAPIHARVENGLAVRGHRIVAAVAPIGISQAEYDGTLLGGEIVEGDHHATRAALEFGVVDALLGGLHGGGPPTIVLRNEGLLFVSARGGNAPDAAARTEVDVLAVRRFDGLAGAALLRDGLRIAAGSRRLPDLAARLEVDPFAIVRKGRVPGIEQDARRLIAGRGGHGEDLLAVIAGRVEDQRLAVGRPHGVDLAAGGADERALFHGIARPERGAPDGGHRGTIRVSQAIASDGRIVSLLARDDGVARAAAVGGHAPEAPAADAIAGVEQILAVAGPGDAADGAIVEGQAAHACARGVAQKNIGALVLRVPYEREADP